MSQSNSEESREQRILRIKREIAAGTYDTPERLMAALDVFLDRAADGWQRHPPGEEHPR